MYLLFIIIFAIDLYYFFIEFFISGLFVHYGNSIQAGGILLGIFCTHSIIFLTLLLMSYGVIHRKTWTRKFMMFFLAWTSIWALWGLLVGNNVVIHLFLLLMYSILIIYLTTDQVKQYFSRMYQYGKYILYTQIVTLKSGLQLPIYFFSSHIPKNGHQTTLPEGYIVKENKKSHMPYLQKKAQNIFIEKSHGKNKDRIHPVIYVINNPQTDTKKESWAVRQHKRILSTHPTKQLAIDKAREVAEQQKATVMVQNINGRFSYGFKPKQSS